MKVVDSERWTEKVQRGKGTQAQSLEFSLCAFV